MFQSKRIRENESGQVPRGEDGKSTLQKTVSVQWKMTLLWKQSELNFLKKRLTTTSKQKNKRQWETICQFKKSSGLLGIAEFVPVESFFLLHMFRTCFCSWKLIEWMLVRWVHKWGLVNKRGYVQLQSKMFLFPSVWKEVDHAHIIPSYFAIGAPFVQQCVLKSGEGSTPSCFEGFARVLVVWLFFFSVSGKL